jgi:hypothetical protein
LRRILINCASSGIIALLSNLLRHFPGNCAT